SSGVQVSPNCITAFNDLKLGKKHYYIIYKISDDQTEIVVEKAVEKSSNQTFDFFTSELKSDECRWAVLDFDYETTEGPRNKICFITWAPESAKIRSKMIYASSKDSIRKSLPGIGAEIQATDFDEVSHEAILEKVTRK
ncbi:cofilin, partial [Lunasporangiospora selenospora]